MSKKKKALAVILIIIFLAADIAAYMYYLEQKQDLPSKANEDLENLPDDAEDISDISGIGLEHESDPVLKEIYRKTYLYEDEFLPGKPQTYTFFDTGIVLICYWTEYETETVKTGEDRGEYVVNKTHDQITIYQNDGSSETYMFSIGQNGGYIQLDDSRYELCSLQVGEE